MKMGPILHQQFVQLRWHVLACFGLMMALPIEEGLINLKDGAGFYASSLSLSLPLAAAPLLAGLIACGNVQADLNDKRHFFWRSRPVSVTLFMTIKYFIGLVLALLVISSPVLLSIITAHLADIRAFESGLLSLVIGSIVISVLSYSMCFLCNVLIRKTARAWLVGMATMCLMFLTPFMLPANYTDAHHDFVEIAGTLYVSLIIVGVGVLALIISLVATARNWHLQTNLKGLLWAAASVVFLLMLLFSRQVANIKGLDEKVVFNPYQDTIKNVEGRILVQCQPRRPLTLSPEKRVYENIFVTAENDKIQFEPIENTLLKDRLFIEAPEIPSYEKDGHQYTNYAIGNFELMANENGLYVYSLYVDARPAKPGRSISVYEYAYLRCFQLNESKPKLISEVDLTDLLRSPGNYPRCVMRRIEDKIVVIVDDSSLIAELAEDGRFKVIEKKKGQIDRLPYRLDCQVKKLSIPLIPLKTLTHDERIQLSIDLITYYDYNSRFFYSRVDKQGDQYVFAVCSPRTISRYDIIGWDNEKIECNLRDHRSFTLLERMLGDTWHYNYRNFIQNGKLYCYDYRSLMVFDIRSARIRKLGHYFQPRVIEDIEVLDSGNILLLLREYRHKDWRPATGEQWGSLQLLKKTE